MSTPAGDLSQRIAAAENALRPLAAYTWLFEPQPPKATYSMTELVERLRTSGVFPNISERVISSWAGATLTNGERAMPYAAQFPGRIGWRFYREDLLLFFAERRFEQLAS